MMEPLQDAAAKPIDCLAAAPIDHIEDTRDQAQAVEETMAEEIASHPSNSDIEEIGTLSDPGSLTDDDHVSRDPATARPIDRLAAAPIDHIEDTRDQAQDMEETMTEETGSHSNNTEIEESAKLSDSGSLTDDDHVSQDPATANDTDDETPTLQHPVIKSAIALLKETVARLETMNERLHTMEANGHMMNDHLGTVDTYIGKIEEYNQTVNKCLKFVEASMDEYCQKGSNHFEYVDATTQKTYEFLQTMDDHLKTVDENLRTAMERLDNADEHFQTVENSLQTACNSHQVVADGLGTIDGRLDTIDGKFRTVNLHVETVEKSLQTMGKRLDTIDEQFQIANEHLDTNKKNLDAMIKIIETTNEDIKGGDGRLYNIQKHLLDIDEAFKMLGGRLNDMDGHVKIMEEQRIQDSGHIKSIRDQLDKITNIMDEQLAKPADIRDMRKAVEQTVNNATKRHSQDHIQIFQQLKALDERMNTIEESHVKSDGQTSERLITIDRKIDSLRQDIQDNEVSYVERMKLVTQDTVNLEKRFETIGTTNILQRINQIDSDLADFMEIIKLILSDKASADQQQQANIAEKLTILDKSFGLLSTHTNATHERQDLVLESIKALDAGFCDRLTIVSNNVLRLCNDIENAGQSATSSVDTLNLELRKFSRRGLGLEDHLKDLARDMVFSIEELKAEITVEKKEQGKNHADVKKRLEALGKVMNNMQDMIEDIDQRTSAAAASSVQVNKHVSTQTQSLAEDITDLGERIISGTAIVVGLLERALQDVTWNYEFLDKTILAIKKMIESIQAHASDLAKLSKLAKKDGTSQATGLKNDIKAELNALEATITSIQNTEIGIYGCSFFQLLPLEETQQQASERINQIQKYLKEFNGAVRVRNVAIKTCQESSMSHINPRVDILTTQLLPLPEEMETLDRKCKHLSSIITAMGFSEKVQTLQTTLTELLQINELSTVITNAQAQVASTDKEVSTIKLSDIVDKTDEIAVTMQTIHDTLILFKESYQKILVRTADISRSTTRIKNELKQRERNLDELKTEMAQHDERNNLDVVDTDQTSKSLPCPDGGVGGNGADSYESNWTAMGTLRWLFLLTAVLAGLLAGLLAVLLAAGVAIDGKFDMRNGELIIRI